MLVTEIHQAKGKNANGADPKLKELVESYVSNQAMSRTSGGSRCRICLEPERESSKFEKTLCNCSKTMPVHVKCLILWMASKTLVKNTETIKFWDLSELKCDICYTPYPTEFQIEGKQVVLFALPEEEHLDYIEMVAYSIGDYEPKGKIRVYDENLEKESISIGRQLSATLCFKDITVSRTHALLFRNEKNWFVQDNNSKFGTLFKIRGE